MLSDEARAAIGAEVLYRPRPDTKPEKGVILDVNGYGSVMVQYENSNVAKSTQAKDLEFFHVLEGPVKLHRTSDPMLLRLCDHGRCPRRHDWLTTCSGCGEQICTGRLKYTQARADAHRLGREYKPEYVR